MTTRAPRPLVVTERDTDLLKALARQVKIVTLDQVHRGWWFTSASDRDMRRRMARLCMAGLIERTTVLGRPVVQPAGPLAVWSNGQQAPAFSEVSSVARARWRGAVRPHTAVSISATAAHTLGGRARRSRVSEVTHDLHLAEVYLRLRRERPVDAKGWIGEALLSVGSQSGEKVPDALVGTLECGVAIEVCGASYTPDKLKAFHEYCERKGYGYELW